MQIKADVQSALICINLRFSFYINELFYGNTMIKYLVVGLGNIGPEYHETRHNIGFMTVEALARINTLLLLWMDDMDSLPAFLSKDAS